MSLIDSINAKAKELEEIELKIRQCVVRKTEILKDLQRAKEYIEEISNPVNTELVTIPISSVAGLDDLSRKCLTDAGIEFLEDIAKMTDLKAQQIPGLGAPALGQIRKAMINNGLNFAT